MSATSPRFGYGGPHRRATPLDERCRSSSMIVRACTPPVRRVAISWPTSKQPRQGYAARWRTVESTTARTPRGPDAPLTYRSSVLIRRQLPRVATTIEARADRPNTGIVVAPRMFCRAARDLFGCFVRGALRCAREAGMCAGRAGVRTNHPNTALPPALFTGPQARRPNTRAGRCVIQGVLDQLRRRQLGSGRRRGPRRCGPTGRGRATGRVRRRVPGWVRAPRAGR